MQALLENEGLTEQIEVDSAGTAAHHVGERADPRARQTATQRGLELTSIARQFVVEDFARSDYVLAMDQDNYDNLLALAPDEEGRSKLYLFRSFDSESEKGASVPDPYYGGPGGFDEVFDICSAACLGLLDHVRKSQETS